MTDRPHILIVDDDERLRDLLKKYLSRKGFFVSAARDSQHARRILSGLDFDLAIVDVMMPGEDGVSLCQWLVSDRGLPTLLLTARGETEERIRGLEAGADDYMSKPFEPMELLLRINAILRRVPPPEEPEAPKMLHLGPIRYDVSRGELWRGDELIRLTATESALMRLFSREVGEVVSRTRLIEDLGRAGPEGAGAQERAVDVQITRLRRKIEADPKNPRHLQTVRGAGYMLVAD
ncbi:response regulator [Palleronia caenipelagi]|uniref:Response regulator transcription factor n=1 Tax=Palleronia caenipelagi TaxID=2489174 RepID=A0A547Q9Y3_9RHOB|nr:response regulator transcription factor [Palleronia caenipelagi]TRD23203.1 response regulator transcription factor [Palleronia caenipelagi]